MPFTGNPRAGVVYTRPYVVELALDFAGFKADRDLTSTRLLDVGCGYGQFIVEASRRLVASCSARGLNATEALIALEQNLRGVEIAPETATFASNAVRQAFEEVYGPMPRDFETPVILEADFLSESDSTRYDVVVGNLPYVKYEAIPRLPKGQSLEWIANHYSCFDGRADYSIAFVQKILGMISTNGTAALVTSNRFTQAEYGQRLRKVIAEECFRVDEVDLSFIRAFDEDVTAYASLFLLKRARKATSRYVRLHSADPVGLAHLRSVGLRRARSTAWYHVASRGSLPATGTPWSPLPMKTTAVLRRLQRKFVSVGQSGIDVRKGPATGADRVFVRQASAFPFERDSLAKFVLPLWDWTSPMRAAEEPTKSILCPYESRTRRLLAFEELPEDVRNYLSGHKAELERRHIVVEQDRPWWSTIDPFDPEVASREKVMVPDLKLGRAVTRDMGEFVPAHTIVYATSTKASLPTFEVLMKSPLADLYRFWLSPGLRSNTPRASPKVISSLPFPEFGLGKGATASDLYNALGLDAGEVRGLAKAHASLASS